ncbi:MAG: fused MFS/spermidine synthase [Gammaproteobacteria bacterium]|nr:fused MFS/spermidine synthase [Gammaproteobacteria bacterium]NNF60369.1 fused MFS/spermidine synthase [Gammaproteobacteria bacterium]
MAAGLLLLLVFCGGFSIMSIELLGGRILAPYFGSSIYVWGSLITVFMLALSIGYLLGGRFSLNNPSVTRFGALFLVAAAAVMPLLLVGNQLMDFVFEYIEDPRYGSLAASMMLFFLPTIALGMISPYAVRLLVEHREHSGHIAGKLYFVSTIGSALGTLLTSFYLVLHFEVNQILIAVVAALILCGLIALGSDQRTRATA